MNRAAIVGAGPSGFYAADQLLKAGFAVDLYDALPTPYGLVRAGVAPDHPKIKSVIRVYAKTATHESFRFFGGVSLGVDLSPRGPPGALPRRHLRRRDLDRQPPRDPRRGPPGLASGHRFRGLVQRPPALRRSHVRPQWRARGGGRQRQRRYRRGPDAGARPHASWSRPTPPITRWRRSAWPGVTEVVLLGRRGPAEAAFTNPELRELGELERADVIVDPAQLDGVEVPEDGEATKRRNVEILRDYSQRTPSGKSHRLELRFLRSPLEILGEGEDGPVTGVRVAINRLVAGDDGRVRAEPTGRGGGDRVRSGAALDRLPRRSRWPGSPSTSAGG